MKSISIPQPWAWLVVRGFKEIEPRSWRMEHRGLLLIHAGTRKVTINEYSMFLGYCKLSGIRKYPSIDELECGGIIGVTDIVDCVKVDSPDREVRKKFAIVSADARPCSFEPMRGRRKVWYVDESEVPGLMSQLIYPKEIRADIFPLIPKEFSADSILVA